MKLSIIIPCYNCSETLAEAVDSVYRQDLDNFEIVLVEDCSTDNTREVIKEIKNKYPEIKDFYNEKNLGGGATRNIAVSKTTGEYIFCLDSDDMLGGGTLSKMLKLAVDKNADGIGIHKSIKFNGVSTNDISVIDIFSYKNEKIPIYSLMEDSKTPTCSLYSTFMVSREAFYKAGGYPEHHGFDTQGFAWRFLLNGLTAYTCEDATYYHRVNFHKSYYIREYESGKLNHNWYKVFEEFLYVFDKKIQDIILNFDLNNTSKILFDEVRRNSNKDSININNPKNSLYWQAWSNFQQKNYLKSQELLEEFIKGNSNNLYCHYYLDLCIKETGKESNLIDYNKIDILFSYKKQGGQVNILIRIIRKILRKIYA